MSSTKTHDGLSLLVITTSGGGGHLQAANAKIAQERLKHHSLRITTHDVLANAGGKHFGLFMIHRLWDSAQRKGSVRALEFWADITPLFDFLFWVPVFIQIFMKLWQHKIDYIIDTQPLCLSSITCAVRLYNALKKKHLTIEKILTELPTAYASHYFAPIKGLSRKNRALVYLVTTTPLPFHNQTREDFWKQHCGLSPSQVSYSDFPIRPSFQKYQTPSQTHLPIVLRIALKNAHEKHLIQDIFKNTFSETVIDDSSLTITIKPSDKITTLMLGSQPVQKASLLYVKSFIDSIRNYSSKNTHHYLFVFCSHKILEDTPLQDQIHALIMNSPTYPANLTIIPMSSQTDDVIAPLYFRSNATLTKAGGITAMELMAVAQGKIWIHHEEKHSLWEKIFSFFSFFPHEGMPKWEYGNATYLREMKGAEMVTPETFAEAAKLYLESQR